MARLEYAISKAGKGAKYCSGGYHPVYLDEVFNQRYKIISKLGYGVYSTVWLAKDLSPRKPSYVALKVLTADSYGSSNPTYELDILKHIKRIDAGHPGSRHVVHLLDDFVHRGPNGKHLCLTMELMGQSVLSVQRRFQNKQLPMHIGRRMATHLLQALHWLHDSCGIIHTDIKPDNILVALPDANKAAESHIAELQHHDDDADRSRLTSRPITQDLTAILAGDTNFKVTDFGVASFHDKHLTDWIQPISLRAPEVFLKAPWDCSVDIWSVACVVYELLQGRVLFRGSSGGPGSWTAEEDQLAQMMELFGPIPTSLIERGKSSRQYFDDHNHLLHIEQLYPCSLKDLLAQTKNSSMSAEDYQNFRVFLQDMLKYEPSERKSARDLLAASWIDTESTKV